MPLLTWSDSSASPCVRAPLPLPRDLDPHRVLDPCPAVVAPPVGGEVLLEPAARFVGEDLVGGGEGEVHAGATLAEGAGHWYERRRRVPGATLRPRSIVGIAEV